MKHLPQGSTSLLCSLLIIFLGVASVGGTSDWEIDAKGTVDRIIDGDTFHAAPVGRVRLADIDTPEVGEPGAKEATEYLASFVYHRRVYLDVDDLYGTDVYDRIVAVVYVRHNATHLLNVNEALLGAGLAEVADFPNEFDSNTWTLYIHSPTEVSPCAGISAEELVAGTVIIIVITFHVFLLYLRSRRRPVRGNTALKRTVCDETGTNLEQRFQVTQTFEYLSIEDACRRAMLNGKEVNRLVREKLLRREAELPGWRAFYDRKEDWKEYPLDFGEDFKEEMNISNPPCCDGWLYHAEEKHLVLLEIEVGGSAIINAAKLLCYVASGRRFEELEDFSETPPRKVTMIHLYKEKEKESRYEFGIASQLGQLFEEVGEEKQKRHYEQVARPAKRRDVNGTFSDWVVKEVVARLLEKIV